MIIRTNIGALDTQALRLEAEDIARLDDGSVDELIANLRREISSISRQIQHYGHEGVDGYSLTWLRNAEKASMARRQNCEMLVRERARRRESGIEFCFMEAAQEALPQDLYLLVLRKAEDIRGDKLEARAA